MKPLHRSTWRTESDCGVLVDVAEGRTTEWAPFREVVVQVDAGMTPAEARRLIVDLQHAVAVAEEFDAPEREAVSTEDQPKPRAEHVHTEACEHRLVSSEVAGVSECYSCGPGVRDQYCPNACPVVLSEVLADSEQVRHG